MVDGSGKAMARPQRLTDFAFKVVHTGESALCGAGVISG